MTSSRALAIPVRTIAKLERQPVSNPGERTVYLPGPYVDPYPYRIDREDIPRYLLTPKVPFR